MGVADGELAAALPPVCRACEVCGMAMRISSDTVTNLNPFASSASKVEGMASMVPG